MRHIILFIFLSAFITTGCTVNFIKREYHSTVEASENSTVYFDPAIFPDIDKEADAKTEQKTDVKVKGSLQ